MSQDNDKKDRDPIDPYDFFKLSVDDSDKDEKPKVVVEHYEPSGFLRFFTFAGDKDCYYITLNNTDNLYMLMEWDNK